MWRALTIFLLIVICSWSAPAVAQFPGVVQLPPPATYNGEPGYGGYPPIAHDVKYHYQDTQVWCWVAVAKMVAEFLRRDSVPSQCAMLQDQYNAPCCDAPQLCTRQGHESEVRNLVARFGGRLSTFNRPADGWGLYRGLQRGPIILHLTLQTGGHFVVATGMKVVATMHGPLGIVTIYDPIAGIRQVRFPELKSVWTGAILVQ